MLMVSIARGHSQQKLRSQPWLGWTGWSRIITYVATKLLTKNTSSKTQRKGSCPKFRSRFLLRNGVETYPSCHTLLTFARLIWPPSKKLVQYVKWFFIFCCRSFRGCLMVRAFYFFRALDCFQDKTMQKSYYISALTFIGKVYPFPVSLDLSAHSQCFVSPTKTCQNERQSGK